MTVSADDLVQHARWLRRLATRLVNDEDVADDLVQDTLIAASDGRPESGLPLRPWLGGILRNLFRMRARSEGRRLRREAESQSAGEDPLYSPESLLETAQLQRMLGEAVESLPEPYRTVVLLRYFHELDAAEIARRQGIPHDRVRWRLKQAREILRKRLDESSGNRAAWVAVLGPWLRRPELAVPAAAAASGKLTVVVALGVLAAVAMVVTVAGRLRAPSSPAVPASSAAAHEPARDGEGSHAPSRGPLVGSVSDLGDATAAAAAGGESMTARGACPSLAALIDEAAAGSVLHLPACVFREAITVDKPLTIVGTPGAEIRGSDPVGDFVQENDGTWATHVALDCGRDCTPSVFVDGRVLERATGERAQGRSFVMDGQGRLRLGFDPGGHEIEVAVRSHWLDVRASGVTLQGLRMKHAAAGREHAALRLGGSRNVVRDCELSDAPGMLIDLEGDRHELTQSRLFRGGVAAVRVTGTGHLVEGNLMRDTGADSQHLNAVDRAAVLVLGAGVQLLDNEIAQNHVAGVLCLRCQGLAVERNRIHHNRGAGLRVNQATAVTLSGNALWSNGWDEVRWSGLAVSCSTSITISGNVLAWNAAGLSAGCEGRVVGRDGRPRRSMLMHTTVTGNTVVQAATPRPGPAMTLGRRKAETQLADGSNLFDDNRFFSDGPPAFVYIGKELHGLKALATTPAGRGARVLDASLRDEVLRLAGVPTTP